MLKTLTALALLAAAPVAANAQTAPQTGASVTIGYADLNLASRSGVAELDRRIARAIDKVCPSIQTRRLATLQAVETCKAAAHQSVALQRDKALAARTGTIQVASGR